MAKTVNVFAIAHDATARRAHTIRCFSSQDRQIHILCPSATWEGHRAVKTPATMQSEIANGENPEFTSFVGASAAASQPPAVSPQIMPRPCSDTPNRFILCTAPSIFGVKLQPFGLSRNQSNTTKRATPASNTKATRKWLLIAIVLSIYQDSKSASAINLDARDDFIAPTIISSISLSTKWSLTAINFTAEVKITFQIASLNIQASYSGKSESL
jgi:hypothetical protein